MPSQTYHPREAALTSNLPKPLQRWLRITRLCGLAVVVLLATGLVVIAAWIAIIIIRTPSDETRLRVATGMIRCSVDNPDLPVEWEISSILPHYDISELPGPALGGIWIGMRPVESEYHAAASQELYLYRTPRRAEVQFERYPIGSITDRYRIWLPLDLTEIDLSADRYEAACAAYEPVADPSRLNKRCAFKARYGRFMTKFSTGVSSGEMSMAEVLGMVQTIDAHMLQCVDSLSDESWDDE